jgi:fatty-acyl-CoA synthase
VSLVAVIGRVDEKWGERPVLVIEPNPEHTLTDAELLACLRGKVADWWIPSVVVRLASMPLAATGKIDKQRLRAAHGAA